MEAINILFMSRNLFQQAVGESDVVSMERGTRERGEARGYRGRQYLFSSSMSEIVWTCHGEHPVRESDIRSRVIEDAKDEEDE